MTTSSVARTLLLLLTPLAASTGAAQQAPIVTSGGASYTLAPGDVVRINVWGQEDFSGQFQIDERGRIEYPVIGEIDIQDRTVAQLRDQIRAGLREIFNRPFVTITPLFRIAVLGAVQQPGLITVDPTLSVLDIVAMAGGPTRDGNINRIALLRSGQETQLGLRDPNTGGQSIQQIGVRSGDQIVVPEKAITRDEWSILIGLAQIALSVAILVNTF